MSIALHQIVAVEKGRKAEAEKTLTNGHHLLQKVDLLSGITRTYYPSTEDGENLPSEAKRAQLQVSTVLDTVTRDMSTLFDCILTKDVGNGFAKADIVVDGVTLAHGVPVATLLFLEKKLSDFRTFVQKIPTLDLAETWTYSATHGCYVSETTRTARTKKVPRNHVKAPATDKHPAQVETWMEDIKVGEWATQKSSGALPVDDVRAMLQRVTTLTEAVKFAREAANATLVEDRKMGAELLGYLFGTQVSRERGKG